MPMINYSQLRKELDEVVKGTGSIGLLTHKNPDGDGLAAILALQEIFKSMGRKADIVLEYPAPDVYDFLDAKKRTKVFSEHLYYKNLIILDCHEEERIRSCVPLLPTASKIIAIDHHMKSQLIDDCATYIDTEMVSAGAIIFNLYEKEISELDEKSAYYVATAIYNTILNDTDNFLNTNVDTETFRICSELMKYNIKPGWITETFLLNKSAANMRFIGEVLSTIDTYDDDKILFMHFTREMLHRHGLGNEATSKLIRWVKGIKDMKVAVNFQEVNENRYRLSLRSNYIDVNKICVKYGGGGHKKASGCEIRGTLREQKKLMLTEIRQQIDLLN